VGSQTLDDKEYQKAVDMLDACGGSAKQASAKLGLNYHTFRSRIKVANAKGFKPGAGRGYSPPPLPAGEMTAEEIMARCKTGYERRAAAAAARNWMRFKVHEKGPFALVFVGDPHMGDNGFNAPLFERDVALIRETPAMWAVGLGDYTNHWSGYLAQKIYPHQDVTRTQEHVLVEWLVSQIKPTGESIWWLMVLGNHDIWGVDKGHLLEWMARGRAPVEEWEARFIVECPNGREIPVHAAHNFPGRSIYNPLHSVMRKGKFTGFEAQIYMAGDTHNWAMLHIEDEEGNGQVAWFCRARGYKYIDGYSTRLGYGNQHYGASITAIIDPSVEGPAAIDCRADLEEAVDCLEWKRSRST
jgi:hypothetical protein